MTKEKLYTEISLLINKALYDQQKINYQEYLIAEEILLNKINTIS